MSLDNWDDVRTALAVARTGTVSGAAAALGVHHATVIRRIDGLESTLRARLFQRHPRGYALTEAGQALLKAATEAEERFSQMTAQIAGAGDWIEGELIVTSLPELAEIVMPRLVALMQRHHGLRLRYLTDPRLFRLDAGEAHVAIRAGARPTEADYVVREMGVVRHRLYATPEYLARHGAMDDPSRHRFVIPGSESNGAPFMRWLHENLSSEALASCVLLVSNDQQARDAMVRAGLALGWMSEARGEGLLEAMWLPEWESTLWLVTHVDLHRSSKVQAAVTALRQAPKDA